MVKRIKVYNVLAILILLYGGEVRALKKKGQNATDINRDEIFQKNSRMQPFWPQKFGNNCK